MLKNQNLRCKFGRNQQKLTNKDERRIVLQIIKNEINDFKNLSCNDSDSKILTALIISVITNILFLIIAIIYIMKAENEGKITNNLENDWTGKSSKEFIYEKIKKPFLIGIQKFKAKKPSEEELKEMYAVVQPKNNLSKNSIDNNTTEIYENVEDIGKDVSNKEPVYSTVEIGH